MVAVHEGLKLAVFQLEDGYWAIDNRCPHRGGQLGAGGGPGPADPGQGGRRPGGHGAPDRLAGRPPERPAWPAATALGR